MTNARMFQEVFGLYATEVWSFTEERFLEWLNDTYLESDSQGYSSTSCIRRRVYGDDGNIYEISISNGRDF